MCVPKMAFGSSSRVRISQPRRQTQGFPVPPSFTLSLSSQQVLSHVDPIYKAPNVC